jgi:hypothetical protein
MPFWDLDEIRHGTCLQWDRFCSHQQYTHRAVHSGDHYAPKSHLPGQRILVRLERSGEDVSGLDLLRTYAVTFRPYHLPSVPSLRRRYEREQRCWSRCSRCRPDGVRIAHCGPQESFHSCRNFRCNLSTPMHMVRELYQCFQGTISGRCPTTYLTVQT